MTGQKPIYVYRSPFGLISIRPDSDWTERWYLVFEEHKPSSTGELLASNTMLDRVWPTPEAVAQAVASQTTNWNFWDALPQVVFPASLDDWQTVPAHGVTSPKKPA